MNPNERSLDDAERGLDFPGISIIPLRTRKTTQKAEKLRGGKKGNEHMSGGKITFSHYTICRAIGSMMMLLMEPFYDFYIRNLYCKCASYTTKTCIDGFSIFPHTHKKR
jgi:hypothetical protein